MNTNIHFEETMKLGL